MVKRSLKVLMLSRHLESQQFSTEISVKNIKVND